MKSLALLIGIFLSVSSWGAVPVTGPDVLRPVRILHVSQQPLKGIELQFRSISEAARMVKPGDLVLIHGGIYREGVVIEHSGIMEQPIVFQAADLEHVVVTGADRVVDWTPVPGKSDVFSTPWALTFIGWSPDFSHGAPPPIGRAEQVIVEGYLMHQVLSLDALSYGSFFVDTSEKKLYLQMPSAGYDITKTRIDISSRENIWDVRGNFVHTRGITFRYAANKAQSGMVTIGGESSVLEDCVMERSNGVGLTLVGRNTVIKDCEIRENGQMGLGGSGTNLLITGCLVTNNNTKNFPRGWEAGGCKISMSKNVVFNKCRFIGNRGVGIWFDIGNEACVVRNCLIADNEFSGIFYEISYGLHAHDNVIIRNGFEDAYGSWGSVAGISLSSSPDCVIERNILAGNAEGFSYREQHRTTPRIGKSGPEEKVWVNNETVCNNIIAYNGVQTWGWFDSADGRQWPRAWGKSKDLSLEDLHLNMRDNVFSQSVGQELFNWSPKWADAKRYTDLQIVRKELNLEQGSVVEQVHFRDPMKMDYRLIKPTLNQLKSYPKGTIPGVKTN